MDTIAGIKAELKRLGKPEWQVIIEVLVANYLGYPFDDPASQSPEATIHAILKTLPSATDEPDALTDEYFIDRLSQADIFSYRAFRRTPAGLVYWEPLRERYIDFVRGGETSQYQTEHEYPAPDIIRAWYYHKIKTVKH